MPKPAGNKIYHHRLESCAGRAPPPPTNHGRRSRFVADSKLYTDSVNSLTAVGS